MNRPLDATPPLPSSTTSSNHARKPLFSDSPALAALMLGLLVFVASLLGILSRPENFLAAIWPANAIMLGILLRVRAAATLMGCLSAIIAFLAADLLTGASLFMAAMLSSANLASIGTGYWFYRSLPPAVVQLRDPKAILYLVVVAAAAGAGAGLIGSFAHLLLFSGSPFSGWLLWFVTELVNYIAILPVLLSAPSWRTLSLQRLRWRPVSWPALLPILALALSCLLAASVGGPGAIAFPLPALLWCAWRYPVFPTTVLTLLSNVWSLIVVASTHTPLPEGENEMLLILLPLAAALIALAPTTLSCIMQHRHAAKLRHP